MSFDSSKLSVQSLKRLVRDQRRAIAETLSVPVNQYQAQEILALTLGYRSWHDTITRIKANGPRPKASANAPADTAEVAFPVLDGFWVRHNRPEDAIVRIAEVLPSGNGPVIAAYLSQFQEGMRTLVEGPKSSRRPSMSVATARETWESCAKAWRKASKVWGKAACKDHSGVAMMHLLSLRPFDPTAIPGYDPVLHARSSEVMALFSGGVSGLVQKGITKLVTLAIRKHNLAALQQLQKAYPAVLEGSLKTHLAQAMALGGEGSDHTISMDEQFPLVTQLMGQLPPTGGAGPWRAMRIHMLDTTRGFHLPMMLELAALGVDVPALIQSVRVLAPGIHRDKEVLEEQMDRCDRLAQAWSARLAEHPSHESTQAGPRYRGAPLLWQR